MSLVGRWPVVGQLKGMSTRDILMPFIVVEKDATPRSKGKTEGRK